jgi:hypothetical protein
MVIDKHRNAPAVSLFIDQQFSGRSLLFFHASSYQFALHFLAP